MISLRRPDLGFRARRAPTLAPSQPAGEGLVELCFPGGTRVLVDFRYGTPGDASIEAAVTWMIADAERTDGDMCAVFDGYAAASGQTAHYYLGGEALIVAIGDPIPLQTAAVSPQGH